MVTLGALKVLNFRNGGGDANGGRLSFVKADELFRSCRMREHCTGAENPVSHSQGHFPNGLKPLFELVCVFTHLHKD